MIMEILSFDVGIKNLAYCRMGSDETIKDWGIINLNENPQCMMCLKKPCSKQSSYYFEENGQKCYYCSTHIKHKTITDKKVRKKKLNPNHDLMNLSQLCVENLRKLNLENVKSVLIENQPALKNPVMKSIQMIIYTFFIMDGVMNSDNSVEKVHMVNARNKLKVYKGPEIDCPYEKNVKNKYKINKYLSVKYTEKMIDKQEDKYKDLFNESKKKDDLADAYLQGIYWLNK